MTNKKAIEWLKLELEKGVSWDDTSESTKNIREQAEVEIKEAFDMAIKALKQEPYEDCISRQSIKRKLQEHHDFFVNAYGGFSNLPQNDKSRVDEISNCIAMVVNEPSVKPQESSLTWVTGADGAKIAFWDVPVWKVTKICEILGEPQESERV